MMTMMTILTHPTIIIRMMVGVTLGKSFPGKTFETFWTHLMTIPIVTPLLWLKQLKDMAMISNSSKRPERNTSIVFSQTLITTIRISKER